MLVRETLIKVLLAALLLPMVSTYLIMTTDLPFPLGVLAHLAYCAHIGLLLGQELTAGES